jgi:AcrR family transcriptional regulator
LREVAGDAGIVPAGFYRHFQDMDELGFALVDESFGRLRQMLRVAREDSPNYWGAIHSSVVVLARNIHDHRLHFRFLVRERNGGVPALRRTIRGEIRRLSNELALYLARVPGLQSWSSEDVQMAAMLMVDTMVAAVEALLDTSPDDPQAEQEVLVPAEKQLRLITLGIPHWRSSSASGSQLGPMGDEALLSIGAEEGVPDRRPSDGLQRG